MTEQNWNLKDLSQPFQTGWVQWCWAFCLKYPNAELYCCVLTDDLFKLQCLVLIFKAGFVRGSTYERGLNEM